ncbi:MAG TPA: hypothetical protein VID28_06240 [Methylomirabilota bacterium]
MLPLILFPLLFIGSQCTGSGGPSRVREPSAAAADVDGYARPGVATFLALPAWYVVYSAEEYAAAIAHGPPSRFPHFRAIRQFWRSYRSVCVTTRNQYPFSVRTHLGLGATGMSFSAEHAVKGAYEQTLGRLTEWLAGHDTPEDAFAARTAREYGRFLRTRPWYEFQFVARLEALWKDTALWGPHPIRKWERRVVLSAEYGVRALYGGLAQVAAKYGRDSGDTGIHVLAENVSDQVLADARIRKVKGVGPRAYILKLPRRQAFTEVVPALARQGVRFRDIAGNEEIFLTVRAPRAWAFGLGPGRLVLTEPILTDRSLQRAGIAAPVAALHTVLFGLERSGATLEHLYDP